MTRAAEKHGSSQIGRQVRGSSLLMVGRLAAKFVNFGVQIAIIRMLTKDDFGAFAYGLAIVMAGEFIVQMGLGRGSRRFVPYHFERGEYDYVIGILATVFTTILVMGALGVGLVWWISGQGWSGFPSGDGARVVLILAMLAPVQALDAVCVQTLACVSKPRYIVFRKHVVGPLLKVSAVGSSYLLGGDSETLALTYLTAGILGLFYCAQLMIRELRVSKVLPRPLSQWRVPWDPVLKQSLPLITSDLVFVSLNGVITIILMSASGESEVAVLRAVVPAAMLNMIVQQSFMLLFLPTASRVFARGDMAGLRLHHWHSGAWVAVLSFPVFALTFGLAPDFVPLLLGAEYIESAKLLAILAVGNYVIVCLAFNAETLQLLTHTRALVVANVIEMSAACVLAILLCQAYGALGAALAMSGARITGAVCRQVFLSKSSGLGDVPHDQQQLWIKIVVAGAAVAAVGWGWQPPILVQMLLAAIITLGLLRWSARSLDVFHTFPELTRIPFLARLVGV